MSEILSTSMTILLLVGAFAGLVAWVRRDSLSAASRQPTLTDDTVVTDLSTPTAREGRTVRTPAVVPTQRSAEAQRSSVLQLS